MNRYDLMLAVKDHSFEKREQFVSDHVSLKAARHQMDKLADVIGRQMGCKGWALYVVERDTRTAVVCQTRITASGMCYDGETYRDYHLVPSLIYDIVQHDSLPRSWKAGVKTQGDPDWVYNSQRFATREEADCAAADIYSRWTAAKWMTVTPDWDDAPNYRWGLGRAVSLDAPPVLPAVEQALRDTGVVVESPDDPTEATRRVLVAQINADPGSREALESEHGQVWSTSELTTDFNVQGFMAPFVVVVRKSDSKKGTLTFQHSPRFYYQFEEAR